MTLRSRKVVLATTIATVIALNLASLIELPRRVFYNPTDSAPPGWYLLYSTPVLRAGDVVLTHLPQDAAQLADARGYLPAGIPLTKKIAATEGTEVCVRNRQVFVEGTPWGATLDSDGRGRALTAWPGCRRLRANEFFLLSTSAAASFDSRYFGPVTRESVLGRLIPLWTW